MQMNIEIPAEWSRAQAWAVMELIFEFENFIWDTFEDQLVPFLEAERMEHPPDINGRSDDHSGLCDFELSF